MSRSVRPAEAGVQLGLTANAGRFWLLVVVNAFVGATVGVERTAVPLLAEQALYVTGATVLLALVAGLTADLVGPRAAVVAVAAITAAAGVRLAQALPAGRPASPALLYAERRPSAP